MIKQNNYPKVFFDDAGVFTDLSLFMLTFGRDSSVIAMETGDHLYFGRVKPFDTLFMEASIVNAIPTTMTVEYWDGTSWEDVENLIDDTNAISRSGFIEFDKPDDWAETSVNSQAAFYVRISFPIDITATTALMGLNIVFSDDQDLIGVYPGVMQYLDRNEDSFILRHQNSRDKIVQSIRNRGLQKYPRSSSNYSQYDEWDFLKVEEVRLWSVYLCMANIFSSLQSNQSDFYKEKADEYSQQAEFYKAAFYLTLDIDDNGLDDDVKDISVVRLVRR